MNLILRIGFKLLKSSFSFISSPIKTIFLKINKFFVSVSNLLFEIISSKNDKTFFLSLINSLSIIKFNADGE